MLILLELLYTFEFTQRANSWLLEFINDSFLLFKLYQFLEIPSELLCHIIVISYILDINKVISENGRENVLVEAVSIASNKEVVVSSVKEFNPVGPSIVELACLENISTVDSFALSFKRLHNDLLSIWLQEHIGNEGSIVKVSGVCLK